MSLQKINARTLVLVLMIIAAVCMRFVSYEFKFLSNFTPVGAIAIFGGVYFTDKWKAYVAVLLSLAISDILINYLYNLPLISDYTAWNCICFALVVLVGSFIKKLNFATGMIVVLAPVLIHWLIMDMPWIQQVSIYPRTFAGYATSLAAAIPFEKNMLLGDILFGALLFGGFELIQNKYTIIRANKKLAV